MSDIFCTADGDCDDDSNPPNSFRLPTDSVVDQLDFFIAPAGISSGKYFRHLSYTEQHNDVEGELELCPMCLSRRRYFACQSCILKMPGRPRKNSQKTFGKLLSLQRSIAHKNESLGTAIEAAVSRRIEKQSIMELRAVTTRRLHEVKAAIHLKRIAIAETRLRLDKTTERYVSRATRLAKLEDYNARNYSGRSTRIANSRREIVRRMDSSTRVLVAQQTRYVRELFDFVYPLSVCPLNPGNTGATSPTGPAVHGVSGTKSLRASEGYSSYKSAKLERNSSEIQAVGGVDYGCDFAASESLLQSAICDHQQLTDSTRTLQLSQNSLQLLTATLTSSGELTQDNIRCNHSRYRQNLAGSDDAKNCELARNPFSGPLTPQISNDSSSGSLTSTLGGKWPSNDDILAALADATMTNYDGEQWIYCPADGGPDCEGGTGFFGHGSDKSGGMLRVGMKSGLVAYKIGQCCVPDRSEYGALKRWLFAMPADPLSGLGGPSILETKPSADLCVAGNAFNRSRHGSTTTKSSRVESFVLSDRKRSSTHYSSDHRSSAASLKNNAELSAVKRIPIASSASADNLPLQLSSVSHQMKDENHRATGNLAGLGFVAQIGQILSAIYDVQLPYPYLVSSCFSSKPIKTSASVGTAYEAGAMFGETGYNGRGVSGNNNGSWNRFAAAGNSMSSPSTSLTEAAFDTAIIQLNANVGSICFAKGPDLPFELVSFERPLNNLRHLRGLVDQSTLSPSILGAPRNIGDAGLGVYGEGNSQCAGHLIVPSDVISACPEWSAGFLKQFEATVDHLETWEDPGGRILFLGYNAPGEYSTFERTRRNSDQASNDEFDWESINDADAMRIPSWEPPDGGHRRAHASGTPPPASAGASDHDGHPSLIDTWLTGATHSVTSFWKSMGGSRAGL